MTERLKDMRVEAVETRKSPKVLRVPGNGQICIGKKWAGRQVSVHEIGANEISIVSGEFVPDNDATFHTRKAQATLTAFDSWSRDNPPKKTDRKALRARLRNKEGR